MLSANAMNAEQVKLGGYQLLALLLLSVNFVTVSMSHALSVVYKYAPTSSFCKGYDDHNDGDEPFKCRSNSTCPGGYYFDTSEPSYFNSVATEWKLVCGNSDPLRTVTVVYILGLLLGGLVAGLVSDRLGRLPVLAICLYAQGIMAIGLHFVQKLQQFFIFRGLQGFFIQGLESCSFILCMELFPTRYRTLVALLVLSVRSMGFAILNGLSFVIPNWRILQLVASVPTAITILYIWIIPESPRWLIAKGKYMEAELLLERFAKYNSLFGSKERDRDNLKTLESGDSEMKPLKPRRKTHADEKSSENIEKSAKESEDLLPSESSRDRDKNNIRVADADPQKRDDLPCELDIQQITKASLMVIAEENCPCNDKSKENETNGPSYLLVSKEALSENENNHFENEEKSKNCLLAFLESRYIGRTCIILMFMWFASSAAFHSQLASTGKSPVMQRSPRLIFAAGFEVVSFLLACPLVMWRRVARRKGFAAAQILLGIGCLVTGIILHEYSSKNLQMPFWLNIINQNVISVLKRVFNIISFFILRLLVIELFPTVSRGTGLGLCVVAEMSGGLFTPLFLRLKEVQHFLIAVFCITVGLLVLIFPETSHKILPDTVEEAKSLGRAEEITLCIKARRSKNPEVLREKLFSEDWVDAGNGIIVDFTEKNPE